MVHAKKSYDFTSKMIGNCFLDGPLQCDQSRFFEKVIAIFLKTKFAEFCRDLPRDRIAIFFLVGPDRFLKNC